MNPIRIAAAGVAVVVAGALAFRLLREPAPAADPPRPAPAGVPSAAPGPAAPGPPFPAVGFVIGSAADGRWGPEPCQGIPGGGLYSLPALRDEMLQRLPLTVSAFLGDVGPGPGELGRAVAHFVWTEIVDDLQFQFVAAGPSDLALGTDFIRQVLQPLRRTAVLCANAADAEGRPLLRGWATADAEKEGRKAAIVCVSVVADSLADVVAGSGSDVRLLPALPAAQAALKEAEAAAARRDREVAYRILLVHGTVDETAEIAAALPGLSFAVAARGDTLGDDRPRRVNGVPIFYPGRGLRFGLRLVSVNGGPVEGALIRMGAEMFAAGSPISGPLGGIHDFVAQVGVSVFVTPKDQRLEAPGGTYVGASRCAQCHSEQVAAHELSPHRRSGQRLTTRLYRTNTQCLGCHATGTFFRGGWRGPDDASDLSGVSCEACHGPGSKHAEEPKSGWGKVGTDACLRCHLPERSPGFDAKAIWAECGHGTR